MRVGMLMRERRMEKNVNRSSRKGGKLFRISSLSYSSPLSLLGLFRVTLVA